MSAASVHGTVTAEPSQRSNPRVVVVDDQVTFRRAARVLLSARGYDVVAEASCAATALEAVERHEPQAVLLDVRLGHDDGFEVSDLLTRSRPGLAVLLTSTGPREDSERVTRCDARGFVPKSRLHATDFEEIWSLRACRKK